jgi:dTDP-4-amino-4,6-dideoxygalactose transaminase/ubiquinone/menaquinone biosynthesis C-methylase UbiE
METRIEVDRLRDVYQRYAASGFKDSKWSSANRGNQAIQGEREGKTREVLQECGFFPLTDRRMLDVGCGTGESLGLFADWGAKPENLFGIDLIPERIRTAQRNFPQINFQLANAESLPFPDGFFDLVAAFTVFTSILNEQMAANICSEINRVLAPGGGLLWYDFRINNPFNKHVRGAPRRHIQRLFPGFSMALQAVSLLPPLARRLGALTDRLYIPLGSLPFLRTHLLGLLTKPSSPSARIVRFEPPQTSATRIAISPSFCPNKAMLDIPFYKPSIGQAEIDEVIDSLRTGWLTTGPKAKRFEADFGRYVQRKHAVAVNSCTAALHLALEAIGVKAGQRVVVPTMTFAATAEVVRYFNAVPLFADCREEDLNLDVADAAQRIEAAKASGQEVAAIIPVHYGGQIGDVAGVKALAKRYDLHIVEDAAHCCPAYYRDDETAPWKSVGTGAAITCFSFYANKTITTGEGGMACTDSEEYADRMRIMSLHGISRDAWKRYTAEGSWYYEIVAPGYKYNLTDIAAAIGLHQLRKADWLHRRRVQLAERYLELLADVEEVVLPKRMPNRIHSWHLFPVRLIPESCDISRADVVEELKRSGIGTSVHWMPLHMHPYYRETLGCNPSDYPRAARIYPQLISLPLYPEMTGDDVERVCNRLKELIGRSQAAVSGFGLPAGAKKAA